MRELSSFSAVVTAVMRVQEIPLFHGDQWEITVPSLLGLDEEVYPAGAGAPSKKEKAKLARSPC